MGKTVTVKRASGSVLGKTFDEIAAPVRLKVKKAKLRKSVVGKAIAQYRAEINEKNNR